MSIAKVRAALETRLGTLTPALSTAYENAAFTPVAGTPYQRVFLLPATPDNEVLGCDYYREIGIFQVSLYYPVNGGPGTAQARAQLLRTHFKRSTTMTSGGVTTTVSATPAIATAFVDGDRYVIPVSIPYRAEIF